MGPCRLRAWSNSLPAVPALEKGIVVHFGGEHGGPPKATGLAPSVLLARDEALRFSPEPNRCFRFACSDLPTFALRTHEQRIERHLLFQRARRGEWLAVNEDRE